MPRRNRKIYTVIDFGSDKIGVMYGICGQDGQPEVLAFAQKNSSGTILKGNIQDYKSLLPILNQALAEADKALRRRGTERGKVVYLVNGMNVVSRSGEACIMFGSPKKITREQANEVADRAEVDPASQDYANFNSFDSYFLLDRNRRVKDPTGETAARLDAFVHLISTEKKRLDKTNSMLGELGFENGGIAVSSAVASTYAVLTTEERNQGVLLIDMGAETCSYCVISSDGVLASGIIPAGIHNAANDLHVGLELPYEYCLSFLRENKLSQMRQNGVNFLEYAESAKSHVRRIPLDSFEKILNARLHETFKLVRDQLEAGKLFPFIGTGCVLTGGGAMLDSALETLQSVTGMHVRRGEPSGFTGTKNGFDYAPSCYAALYGMLKFIIEADAQSNEKEKLGDTLADLFDDMVYQFETVKKRFHL